jgi:hypothetical protein
MQMRLLNFLKSGLSCKPFYICNWTVGLSIQAMDFETLYETSVRHVHLMKNLFKMQAITVLLFICFLLL